MSKVDRKIRIVITGPESTGKTTLAEMLSTEFGGIYLSEFARSYVENLDRNYTFDDIKCIAEEQKKQYLFSEESTDKLFFFDTWLIVTKVWFEWVYNKVPRQLDEDIRNYPVDLFLLCRPDIPWKPDAVRENGGETRYKLFDAYKREISNYGFPYVEVEGLDELRFQKAVNEIKSIFPKL